MDKIEEHPDVVGLAGQEEQVVRSEAEKAAAKARKKKKQAKKKTARKGKPGRPKGSKNRDKTQVELTEELKRIQKMGMVHFEPRAPLQLKEPNV